MKGNAALLKILSAAPPPMTPLMALIAQITKKGKSWKLLKLLLFHACLLPAF